MRCRVADAARPARSVQHWLLPRQGLVSGEVPERHARPAAGTLRWPVRHAAHRGQAWTSPVHTGDGASTGVTDCANHATTPMLVSCTACV